MGTLHSPVVEVSFIQGQGRGGQALASQYMQEEGGGGGGLAVPCSNKEQLEAIRDACGSGGGGSSPIFARLPGK